MRSWEKINQELSPCETIIIIIVIIKFKEKISFLRHVGCVKPLQVRCTFLYRLTDFNSSKARSIILIQWILEDRLYTGKDYSNHEVLETPNEEVWMVSIQDAMTQTSTYGHKASIHMWALFGSLNAHHLQIHLPALMTVFFRLSSSALAPF